MFDISFPEIALCLVVALVVLGPERLPVVARTLGRWVGHARSYMRNLSAELERETQVSDLKRQLDEARRALTEHVSAGEDAMRKFAASSEDTARKTTADIHADIKKP
ncbi:MAG: Sec-independent protein translocase protein TatB [Stenotrophobium sp.]